MSTKHSPDFDAWRCDDCGGTGRVTRYRKVTHQLGTDELPFYEECEACGGFGLCGPDADQVEFTTKEQNHV